ncbi:hypothetical protein [Clostridioides difficile]
MFKFIAGFILTKWYVNMTKIIEKALEPAKGFILTKWYINSIMLKS